MRARDSPLEATARLRRAFALLGVAALAHMLHGDIAVVTASVWTSYWALTFLAAAGYYEP